MSDQSLTQAEEFLQNFGKCIHCDNPRRIRPKNILPFEHGKTMIVIFNFKCPECGRGHAYEITLPADMWGEHDAELFMAFLSLDTLPD